MAKRFTQANDIIGELTKYEGASAVPFAWRKSWLVRRDLLPSGILHGGSPVRRVPGLPFNRLLGVAADALQNPPVHIGTAADVLQVGERGTRLRSFYSQERSTLKLVDMRSHYGPATLRELEWRSNFKSDHILIPRLEGHEKRGAFLLVREELVEGRGLRLRRDQNLIVSAIVRPLVSFYEAQGIKRLPLAEALAPLLPFLQERHPSCPSRLFTLVEQNPMVAVSLCHNDLLPSNLAVTAKGVYFLDWGQCGASICGRDFVKIAYDFLSNAKIRGAVDGLIRRLHADKLCLDDLIAIEDGFYALKKALQNPRLDTSMEALALDRSLPIQ